MRGLAEMLAFPPEPLLASASAWLLAIVFALVALGLTVVLWRNPGRLGLWGPNRNRAMRIACEDALKHIHNEHVAGQQPNLNSLAGVLQISVNRAAELLADMERKNLVSFQGGVLSLTPEGRRYALHIIRAHRLWERFLADETGFKENEWHRRAEQYEHDLTREEVDALDQKLNHPSHDPHGDPIPTADGHMDSEAGQPLTTLQLDGLGRILHLEDEPPHLYAQLTAQGLRPGMEVRVLEKTPDHIRFWAGGDEQVLATLLANSVTVRPISAIQTQSLQKKLALASLRIGTQARVLGLSPACRGAERRRLLDLGFVPGAVVEAEMASPTGDPTAYRIRGTLIALRREQANLIRIAPGEESLAA